MASILVAEVSSLCFKSYKCPHPMAEVHTASKITLNGTQMVGCGWSARTAVSEGVICVCEGRYMAHPDTDKYWKSLLPLQDSLMHFRM